MGIDPEVDKIVPSGKKWKNFFMRYTKLTCARVALNKRSI